MLGTATISKSYPNEIHVGTQQTRSNPNTFHTSVFLVINIM